MGWMKRYFFPELDSTQSLLREWAENHPYPSGTLVWTFHQRAGYGRKGSSWYAAPGESLTFSFLLRENVEAETLLARAALALYDTASPYAHSPLYLKWPNDLWAGARGKLAGILAEVRWAGAQPLYAIVGIGVNVYQQEFPAGLQAVSLAQIGNPPSELERLLEGFEEAFQRWNTAEANYVRERFVERAWREGILSQEGHSLPAYLLKWTEANELYFETPKGLYICPAGQVETVWRARFSV